MLSLLKWPLVACILAASFFPNHASARARSAVDAVSVEHTVRAYYAGIPVLVRIADCESQFRQYDQNGKPFYNEKGSSAVGVMQIMSSIHRAQATKMGMDILTLEGNLAYAQYLYREEGTSPWDASKSCWRS